MASNSVIEDLKDTVSNLHDEIRDLESQRAELDAKIIQMGETFNELEGDIDEHQRVIDCYEGREPRLRHLAEHLACGEIREGMKILNELFPQTCPPPDQVIRLMQAHGRKTFEDPRNG